MDETLGSRLCIQCGLCCDGSLFTTTLLDEPEVNQVLALGHAVTSTSGETRMNISPCPSLKERQCSCYERRPNGCRRFRCRLLDMVERGEVDLQTASEYVAEMRRVADDLSMAAGGRPAAVALTGPPSEGNAPEFEAVSIAVYMRLRGRFFDRAVERSGADSAT